MGAALHRSRKPVGGGLRGANSTPGGGCGLNGPEGGWQVKSLERSSGLSCLKLLPRLDLILVHISVRSPGDVNGCGSRGELCAQTLDVATELSGRRISGLEHRSSIA